MTANKHTPGPWKAGFSDGSAPTYITDGADKPVVRSGQSQGLTFGVLREQDARLIAAAPELLEALVDAIVYLQNHLPDEALAPHRAAVYKAMGTAP